MTDQARRDAPPLSIATKLLYSFGALGSSMKLRVISTFLMIYYNQVLGVSPALVGTVLMVVVVADAVLDPIIGQVSDNFRSRWGRRHPFMLASALPYAASFYLLWNPPPGLSEQALAGYLLACLVSVRFFDTFFELPHQALAPELAKDYDERTRLYAMRHFFSVVGTFGAAFLAYQVFLKENADGTGGVLARDGYFSLSIAVALILLTAILFSTFGTARRIPYLRSPPIRKITLWAMLKEMALTLRNRSFIITTAVWMLWAISGGARGAFDIYFGLYFWELKQMQLLTLAGITAVGGFLGVALAPIIARYMGKKYGVITVAFIAAVIHMTPISLRLLGLAPPNGTPELLVLLYGEEIFNAIFAGATYVLMASIMADVVEDVEVKTGRRSEGLLLSAGNLFRKSVSGVGIFIGTATLTLINFPRGAERGEVPAEVLHNLGLVYIPMCAILYSSALVCLFFLDITRKKHEDNLRTLEEAAALSEPVEPASSPAPAIGAPPRPAGNPGAA